MKTNHDKKATCQQYIKLNTHLLCLCLFLTPLPAYSTDASIVINAKTGNIISEHNANHLWFPASLTKVMTLYLTFKALKSNKIKLHDKIIISKKAANQPKVRLGLKAKQKISIEQAILAVALRSANDAAFLLAEHLGKTESLFSIKMTEQARLLGMNNTVFLNASGLPHNKQVSTARDMAVLAMAIGKDYPQYFKYFSTPSFTYKKKVYFNSNQFLKLYPDAKGMKTGFTCGSGYNLIASVNRKEQHLIAVLMGAKSGYLRTKKMSSLLNSAFKQTSNSSTKNIIQPQEKSLKSAMVQLSSTQCQKLYSRSPKQNKISKWTLIFGAFPDKNTAKKLIKTIKPKMGDYVKKGHPVVIKRMMNGVLLWHALWSGLEQSYAGQTCKTLWEVKAYCRVLHPSIFTKENTQWN